MNIHKIILKKWLQIARHFPIVRIIPVIGAGKPKHREQNEEDTDSTGGA
jgi:hypothetical protein